jgi:tetratricopeptide (TPR) repeat protein
MTMRLLTLTLAFILLTEVAAAQRHRLGTVDTATPEGKLLQQIGQEQDYTRKLALLEQFASQSPKHESIDWVYEQMQVAYTKTGQADKAIETGDKLLAMDPNDLDAAHNNLKAAEAKNDPDLIRKWSDKTSAMARKVVASPKPSKDDEVEAWKTSVDFARQLDTYTEYALYAGAVKTTDPRKRLELAEALETRNPSSQYVGMLAEMRFNSYVQLGDNVKALAFAEKTLAAKQDNEDMLAYVANQYAEKKRDPDKVVAYSARVVELMNTKPKPDGVNEADWAKKRKMLSGLAHYMSGSTLFDQQKLPAADKELRLALPLVEGNDPLKAATLFYAGLANYQMKNFPDALKFNQQCAAIKSPFQAKAAENVRVMKSQSARK